jgi:hypothetical protein
MYISIIKDIPVAGVGFIIGAFTPSVGRKIKALFVKESTAAKTVVAPVAGSITATVVADATKIVSKL